MISFKQFLLTEEKGFRHDPESAYSHALSNGKRDPKVEKILLKHGDSNQLFNYAKYIIHGRWPEAENALLKYPWGCLCYVEYIVKDRFPKVEPELYGTRYWLDYLSFLRSLDENDKGKRLVGLIKDMGMTQELLDNLNAMGMPYDVQEWICQNRPDLINQIEKIWPSLDKKYQHEKELGNADL